MKQGWRFAGFEIAPSRATACAGPPFAHIQGGGSCGNSGAAAQPRGRTMTPLPPGSSKAISRRLAALAIALAVAGLTGCTEGVIYNSHQYLSGTALYVGHIGGSNLPTVIRGNPSALPKADFDQIVRDDMKGSNFGRPITFVAGPDNPPFPGYRMVLIFNGPVAGQSQLCKDMISGGGGPSPEGRIELVAAFCSGDRPVSALAGGIGEIADPKDPRFRAFLRMVGMRLFSPNNPDDRPDRDVNLPVL
jgi:hypothetical protein